MSSAQTHFPPLTSAAKSQRLHAGGHLLVDIRHSLSLFWRGGTGIALDALQKLFRDTAREDDARALDATTSPVPDTGTLQKRRGDSGETRQRTTARVIRCALHDNEPAVNGTGLCAYHLAQKLKAHRGDKAGAWPDVTL